MALHNRLWFDEGIDQDLRWLFGIKKILGTSKSEFQDIELVDSGPFGKVLILDGKLQSAEFDEFVYHELLVHPPMLHHPSPKSVFIMGGGEGSTAREILRNKNVERVVMCDIDEEVVDFCKEHLDVNKEAFANRKLKLVINDAYAELVNTKEKFDVIVGDLADPVECGPCFQLYTKEFYTDVIQAKLNPGGIFVTQSGAAGILYAKVMFAPLFKTLSQVFKYVKAYAAHIPSFADTWGWIMASDEPFPSPSDEEIDQIIKNHIGGGELRFLDGSTLNSVFALNKHVKKILANETEVFTKDNPSVVFGRGSMRGDFENSFEKLKSNKAVADLSTPNGVSSNGVHA